jgi:hypothetical protein
MEKTSMVACCRMAGQLLGGATPGVLATETVIREGSKMLLPETAANFASDRLKKVN